MIPAIQWSQLYDDPQVFDDPQLFDDPQIFDDQLEVWTLIIEKSTVIPPSLMVLFYQIRASYAWLCMGNFTVFFGPPTRKSVTFPPLTTISSLPLPRKSRAEQGADEAASVCKASTFSWRLTLDGNRWPAAFSIGQTSFLRDKLRAGEVCQPVVILRLLFFIALPPLRKDQAFYRCWSFACIACITCITCIVYITRITCIICITCTNFITCK